MNLTPSQEQQLVLQAVRRCFNPASLPTVDPPPPLPVDWQRVGELALRQGVAPLVYAGRAAVDPGMPSSVRDRLRAASAAAALASCVALEPTLRQALGAMAERGLRPIVLKGAALAFRAYRKPFHRSYSDIDLLLPDAELHQASQALIGLGYRVDDSGAQPTHHLKRHYCPASGVAVELHHRHIPEPNPYAVDVEQLWARASSVQLAGVEARILAPEDALHLACLHLAFSHRYQWFPLRNLTDLLALTTTYRTSLDWEMFLDTVRRSRSAGAVYWPLWLSVTWLGAPVPADVLARLAPAELMRRVLLAGAAPRFGYDGQALHGWGAEVLSGALLELSLYTGCSTREQVGAVLRSAFPPRHAVGHLPPRLTRSRLRYLAYLGHPGRIVRGVVGVGQLMARSGGVG